MNLIIILLITVSVLTLLSGISVLSGAKKSERSLGLIFFTATFFALTWALFVGIFLTLPESTNPETARTIVHIYYISAPLMCWALMSYACAKYTFGKILMGIFGTTSCFFIYTILKNDALLFSSITLSETSGNIVNLEKNWFILVYGIYHFLTVFLYMAGLIYAMKKTRSVSFRRANLMVLIGFSITGIIALTFNFILPAEGKYDTVWIGPLAMCFAWVLHYYAILKYRLLDLSGPWLKILSYIIIMSLAAIVYLTIFFVIFIALFKVSSPSTSVIILNIAMITFVLLLFPALTEISDHIRSLAAVHEIDLVYLVKKLVIISKSYINYSELTNFLAEHLHFNYIGLLIDNKLYSSNRSIKISIDNLEKIEKLKTKNLWIPLDTNLKEKLKNIEAIAELKNARGEIVGKILLGRPLGGINLNSRDINELETAFSLISATISAEKPITK